MSDHSRPKTILREALEFDGSNHGVLGEPDQIAANQNFDLSLREFWGNAKFPRAAA